MKNEVVTLISEHHSDPPERIRHSGIAIIIKDNKILLSHELNTNIYMSPGGGLEENETLSECCIREVEEETGLTAETTSDEFITVKEDDFDGAEFDDKIYIVEPKIRNWYDILVVYNKILSKYHFYILSNPQINRTHNLYRIFGYF